MKVKADMFLKETEKRGSYNFRYWIQATRKFKASTWKHIRCCKLSWYHRLRKQAQKLSCCSFPTWFIYKMWQLIGAYGHISRNSNWNFFHQEFQGFWNWQIKTNHSSLNQFDPLISWFSLLRSTFFYQNIIITSIHHRCYMLTSFPSQKIAKPGNHWPEESYDIVGYHKNIKCASGIQLYQEVYKTKFLWVQVQSSKMPACHAYAC